MLVGRELNPYFAEGGSGMPAPAGDKQAAAGGVVGGGDGGGDRRAVLEGRRVARAALRLHSNHLYARAICIIMY